jgi:glycosyltransferase involved in cell wall biosynthesis
VATAFQWLYRWLFPLARPLPEVDVVHAAMAGVCSIVAVAAKLEHGAGFCLTEHGVYLRERYLAEGDRRDSYFLKLLALRFARRMTEMSYALADQISPCCDYNQRWELQVGAEPAKLETIYYGVDGVQYAAEPHAPNTPDTVVWVGRINPLKDVETLLRAAAQVVRQRPDVKFLLYGSAPAEDADYYQRCLALHAELQLQETVTFCGYTDRPAAAYNSGDIVVLSSISEGFPYSTLEAMLCGRPVVATAVGGIPEQIEGAGIAVEPRNPEAMAQGILTLLEDPSLCRALGVAARERASSRFAARRFSGAHYTTYRRLSRRSERWQPDVVGPRRAGPAGHGVPPPREPLPPGQGDQPGHPREQQRVRQLAEEIQRRTARPVDALEVAAVIESSGVTDLIARQRYGFPDTFRLAEAVFTVLRTVLDGEDATRTPRDEPVAAEGSHLDTARHPLLALLPSTALLTAIWLLTHLGHWGGDRVLSLALGMTAGMLFTNGFAVAMGRGASSLISLGKDRAARRFLLGSAGAGVLTTAALSAAVPLLRWDSLNFIEHERSVFFGAAVALATIWMLAAALSLVSVSGWAGIALVAGVVTGAAVDRGSSAVTPAHLGIGTAVGFTVVVSVMVYALNRELSRHSTPKSRGDTTVPGLGYVVLGGLPYFVYGALGVGMFLSVHLIGWSGLHHNRSALSILELGLFLPLIPTVFGSGNAEGSLRRFWVRASELQSLPVETPMKFGAELISFYRYELWRYARGVLRGSIATIISVEILIQSSALSHVVPPSGVAGLRLIYLSGLAAYGLLGWGQFNSMFCLSLLRWEGPVRAVLLGTVVTAAVGTLLVHVAGYQTVGLALVLGATAYGLVSLRSVHRVLAAADFHYAMAI